MKKKIMTSLPVDRPNADQLERRMLVPIFLLNYAFNMMIVDLVFWFGQKLKVSTSDPDKAEHYVNKDPGKD